jgi:hypothetical protein
MTGEAAPGETDLARMLATLDVERRPGAWAVVHGDHGDLRSASSASIHEDEGWTHVVPAELAERLGVAIAFRAAWLTLTVHSSLAAVGLTAAVSRALGEAGIACNVLAGCFHDHLLVPVDRADDAVAAIVALRYAPPPVASDPSARA